MAALAYMPRWFEQCCEVLKKELDLQDVMYGQMVSSDKGFVLGAHDVLPKNQLILQRNLQVGSEFFCFSRSDEQSSVREAYVFRSAVFDQGVFYLREKVALALKQSKLDYHKLSAQEMACFERWLAYPAVSTQLFSGVSSSSNVPCRRYYLYADNPRAYITARELEYLRLIVQGYKTENIAERLSVSAYTVQAQLRNIRKRLNCRSIIEVVNILYQNKLIMPK